MKPFLMLMMAASAGCATRSLPASVPAHSALSITAAAGHRHSVTTALESDPPLPGDPTAAWPGLDPTTGAKTDSDAEAASTKGHQHHGH